MKGLYCANREEPIAFPVLELALSSIAAGMPFALRFPLTISKAYSELEGPLNPGGSMTRSLGDWIASTTVAVSPTDRGDAELDSKVASIEATQDGDCILLG